MTAAPAGGDDAGALVDCETGCDDDPAAADALGDNTTGTATGATVDGGEAVVDTALRESPVPPGTAAPAADVATLDDVADEVLACPPDDGTAVTTEDPLDAGGAVLAADPLDAGGAVLATDPLDAGGAVLAADPLDAGGAVLMADPLDAGGAVLATDPLDAGGAVPPAGPLDAGGAVLTTEPLDAGGAVLTTEPLNAGAAVPPVAPLAAGTVTLTVDPGACVAPAELAGAVLESADDPVAAVGMAFGTVTVVVVTDVMVTVVSEVVVLSDAPDAELAAAGGVPVARGPGAADAVGSVDGGCTPELVAPVEPARVAVVVAPAGGDAAGAESVLAAATVVD